jgi:hypothetical protein
LAVVTVEILTALTQRLAQLVVQAVVVVGQIVKMVQAAQQLQDKVMLAQRQIILG